MAVLPTPGSPMSTGLFFVRRDRIWMTRSISSCAADDRVELVLAGQLGEVAAELVEDLAVRLVVVAFRRRADCGAGRSLLTSAAATATAGRTLVAREQLNDLLANTAEIGP